MTARDNPTPSWASMTLADFGVTMSEPWTDAEAACLLGALALRFAAEPETFAVFLDWLRHFESNAAIPDTILTAGNVAAQLGPDYIRVLGGHLLLALQRQLLRGEQL